MKRLVTTLAAIAGTCGLYAATTGTSFEGLIPAGSTVTNFVDVLGEVGSEIEDGSSKTPGDFWDVSGAEEEDGLVVSSVYEDAAALTADKRHTKFQSDDCTNSYLAISTKKNEFVTRYANAEDGGSHSSVVINKSYYFDSLVQFTAFETNKFATEVLGGDGKMAIWLQADVNPETLEAISTNLVVSAGYLKYEGGVYSTLPTNYLCRVVGDVNVFDGGWHRVSVKAFDTVYAENDIPAFAIAIDGMPVYITNDIYTAGLDSSKLSQRATTYFNNSRLFPSTAVNDTTITSVSFSGVGAVDDVLFSDVADLDWFKDGGFTIKLGEGVSRITYSRDGGSTLEPYIESDKTIEYNEPDDPTVTIVSIDPESGYVTNWTYVADSDVTVTGGNTFAPQADNQTITISAVAAGATVVSADGTPVSTPFATAKAAFDAISAGAIGLGTGPFTVTLSDNAAESITLNDADAEVVLDLAGNDITGDSGDGAIVLSQGTLTITNSTVEVGTVSAGTTDNAVYVEDGILIVGGGIYDGAMGLDDGDAHALPGCKVTGGKFEIASNEGDYYSALCEALAAGLGSDYELAAEAGESPVYYVVQEKAPSPTTATVTFDVDGDTTAIASQTVDIGDCATEPSPAPSKDGYTFDCWKLNDVEFDFSMAITEDITLVAAWTINTYDVTFTTNGVEYVVQSVDYNAKATKPADPVGLAGKEFVSWQQEGYATDYDFDTLVTSNFTVVATWSNHVYSVKYNLDLAGATNAEDNITSYTIDTSATPLLAAGCVGYTFNGWTNSAGTVVTTIDIGSTGDLTLYASWTINAYDVTFTTNGVAYVVQNKDYNTKATKPADPVGFAGKEFKSWQQEGYATDYDFDTFVTSNFTVVATWSNHVYSVTYNLDLAGATNAVDNILFLSYTVETEEFELRPAGCDSYNFLGWTNSVGETVSEIAGGRTGDVTLYAKWEAAGGGFPGGDGARFDIDTATQAAIEAKLLPAGKALTDVADTASGMTYAQAYALDLLDTTGAEAEVSALNASIELQADGETVIVSLAKAPRAAYTVTLKVYTRESLTSGDWSALPVETYAYGDEVAIDKNPLVDAEFYKVTVSISNATP